MRSKLTATKAAAAREAAERKAETKKVLAQYGSYRAHLAMSMISDMFEHHGDCRFKDCRSAGRCLAFDNATGVCPMPFDTTRALMFLGMIWFHEAMSAAEDEARQACDEDAWRVVRMAASEATSP